MAENRPTKKEALDDLFDPNSTVSKVTPHFAEGTLMDELSIWKREDGWYKVEVYVKPSDAGRDTP